MPMLYTDEIQAATIRHKMQSVLCAIRDNLTDNDEALETRGVDALDHRDGFTVSMPAALDYYRSTGSGTPMLDSLVERHENAQAAEWARQYPQRATLFDCASDEGEHAADAQEWLDAALEGETVWLRVEVLNDHGRIEFRACFTDDVNAPHGPEYSETLDESAFVALDGDGLESLASRIAAAPYLSLVTVENSGGKWHAWFGTRDGATAYNSTGGHDSEAAARAAVERAMR